MKALKDILTPSRCLSWFGGLMFLMICCGSTGCASIICSGKEKVEFTSTPVGAHVEVVDSSNNTVGTGTTPCNIVLARGGGYFQPARYTLKVSADGYPAKEVSMVAGFNGMYLGNLIFGGLIGMVIVDPLTGAMFSFPDNHIDMGPAGAAPAASNVPPLRWPANPPLIETAKGP